MIKYNSDKSVKEIMFNLQDPGEPESYIPPYDEDLTMVFKYGTFVTQEDIKSIQKFLGEMFRCQCKLLKKEEKC